MTSCLGTNCLFGLMCVCDFREGVSVCVCASFPFGFEGEMLD